MYKKPQGSNATIQTPRKENMKREACNPIIDVSNIDFCKNIVMTVSPNITGNIAIGNNTGYSSTNTNRVNIPTECETCDVDTPITFNANLFKEVLVANRECTSAVLEVSTEGLAKVNFKIDDFDSTYYIVAMQDVD